MIEIIIGISVGFLILFLVLFDARKESTNKLEGKLDAMASFPLLVQDIQRQLGEVSKISALLTNPASLKVIGEKNLEFLLKDVLPHQYVLVQHELLGVGIVDTAITVNGKVLPIDSKFPKYNENKKEFERAVKDRIKEAGKYVVPNKGTTDFCLMFIPSELIYMRAFLEEDSLLKYAWDNKVVPVSPNILFLYLSFVMSYVKRDEIKNMEQTMNEVKSLLKKFEDVKNYLEKANKQSRDALNNIEATTTRVSDAMDVLKKIV